jgi:hypothetical protein
VQNALKEEYVNSAKEAQVNQYKLVETKAALRSLKLEEYTLMKQLKTGNLENVTDSTISDVTLTSELEILRKDIDIKKITDKLNDGTSRKPTGTIENPIENQGSEKLDSNKVKGKLEKIREEYYERKFKNSLSSDQWLSQQMEILDREGALPKEGK